MTARTMVAVELPRPVLDGAVSLERALRQRRSVREYAGTGVTRAEVAQLLWAAQGLSGSDGMRTAPSAGALYPLEVYLVAGDVEALPGGVHRYDPEGHTLELLAEGDARPRLSAAALGQDCVRTGAAVIVLVSVPSRTTPKYGARGKRYVYMEAGHVAQNICLEATALGLGTVTVGAFDDEAVARALGLRSGEQPLYLLPVGRPA